MTSILSLRKTKTKQTKTIDKRQTTKQKTTFNNRFYFYDFILISIS